MPTVIGVKDGTQQGNTDLEKRDELTVVVRTFSRVYYVLADTLADDELAIVGTVGIPPLFTLYNGMSVRGQAPRETTRVIHPVTDVATTLWEVTISYSNAVDPDDDEDPLNLDAVIRWFGETEEEILEKDAITGRPIQTDADEPILITTPYVVPVLEIKRYEVYPFIPNVILDFSHHTNSAVFWGVPAGHALFMPPEVDEETVEGVKYAVVTYRIKFKIKPGQAEPWQARVLHHGFKYRETPGAKPTIYQDRHGNPATVNLVSREDDAPNAGTKLADGANPHFKQWHRFQKIDFNILSLGPF